MCFLLIAIWCQLRFHLKKGGMQVWLLSCIDPQDYLVSQASCKKKALAGPFVHDWRAVFDFP